MNNLTIYHGSQYVVERPEFGRGNIHNDYGQGFYCTLSAELASEWAAKDEQGGFLNEYALHLENLNVVDLDDNDYGVLEWLYVLTANRVFDVNVPIMQESFAYLHEFHSVDLSHADIVMGWRADDSYFSFAKAFLANGISVKQLEQAMRLGDLGKQVVLKTKRAFDSISFVDASVISGSFWHPKRIARDQKARRQYLELREEPFSADDVYVVDLIREAKRNG